MKIFVGIDARTSDMDHSGMDCNHQYIVVHCIHCCYDILLDNLLLGDVLMPSVDGQITTA